MRGRKGLSRRQARHIRRGIVGARMTHQYALLGDWDKAAQVYGVVHAFGGVTREALRREYARLVVDAAEREVYGE